MKILSEAGTVLFNTELQSQRGIEGDLIEHTFAPTPPMSTYLVGIVVGELQASHMVVDVPYEGSVEIAGRNKLNVSVYNRIGYQEYVELAKHAAAAAVEGTHASGFVPDSCGTSRCW
jgi:aminopeptidase N